MRLIAIDGNSLLFRAFYALPAMTSKTGVPTGALHGFLMMLSRLIKEKPEFLAVGFDLPGKTFRHEKYSQYKAGRRETPEELIKQFPLLKDILRKMGIAVIECEHFEADDILGTLSRRANAENIEALLVTGDRDALQLVTPDTHVLMTRKGLSETTEYDIETLKEEYGLSPERMVDLKGLMGDNSDNLPGIKGVGEKTALKLLAKYGSLENVLSNAENEKGALREKLLNGRENAEMSYDLGTIRTDAPIRETVADCAFDTDNIKNVLPMLTELGLRAVAKRMSEFGGGETAAANEDASAETESSIQTENVDIKDMDALETIIKRLGNAENFAVDIKPDEITFMASGDSENGQNGESGRNGENGKKEKNSAETIPLYRVKLGGNLIEQGFAPDEVINALKPIFENEKTGKILFDAKRVMNMLAGFGVSLKGLKFDLMIADYLINALHPANDIETLAKESGIVLPDAAANASSGVLAAVKLYRLLNEQLKKQGMEKLYNETELPLVTVLFDMEQAGFTIDKDVLNQLRENMTERISELENEIYAYADEKFNILSPKQLGRILFDKLGLPARKKTKTGYSTDSETLEALKDANPIIDPIIEYRFLTKLKSTFIDAMLEKIGSDGKIHSTFNQNVTATGRISSQEPNLQNIPVRTELGREIRRAFVASPGNILVDADYSQIELRVLAHISGDEALISSFINGEDIHTRTASEVFGVPIDEVTGEMRSAAKAVNFGIVYGISPFGLSKQLGIPVKRAGEYINKYLERYPGVRDYMQRTVEEGKEKGYAETVLGRRRELPELKSSNHNTRAFGERVAMNMPIQGSAADIIKLAMVKVHEKLRSEGLRAKLILQIHDELIIDTPIDEEKRVSEILHECMVNVAKLSVPLIAEVKTGHSWFDAK